MSDWSSFSNDKNHMDDWRAFLAESKSPQKIEEIELPGAKKRREKEALIREKEALITDRKLSSTPWLTDDGEFLVDALDDYATKVQADKGEEYITPIEMINWVIPKIKRDKNGVWKRIMDKAEIRYRDLIQWLLWRFEKGFSPRELDEIEKLRANFAVASEEEETDEEGAAKSWTDKFKDIFTRAEKEAEESAEDSAEEEGAEDSAEEEGDEKDADGKTSRLDRLKALAAKYGRAGVEKLKDKFKSDEEDDEEEDTSPYNWKEKPWGISSKENGESLLNVFKDYGIDAEIANKVAALVTKLARNEDVVLEEVTLRGRTDEPQRIFYPDSMKKLQQLLRGLNLDAETLDNIKIALNKWGKYNTVKFAEVEVTPELESGDDTKKAEQGATRSAPPVQMQLPLQETEAKKIREHKQNEHWKKLAGIIEG